VAVCHRTIISTRTNSFWFSSRVTCVGSSTVPKVRSVAGDTSS
jgi:hypothetical protein